MNAEYYYDKACSLRSSEEVLAQLPNELIEGKHIRVLRIFLGQFMLGRRLNAIFFLNAVIGFYKVFKAENSIAVRKKMTALQAKMRHDGQDTSIPPSGIVSP